MSDDPMRDVERLDAALEAMRSTTDVPREAVARIAARAVLASAPRTMARTWAVRAAAALAVVALGSALVPRGASSAPAVTVTAAAPPVTTTLTPVVDSRARPIVFELDAPAARSVQVLGDFNGWSRAADRMQRDPDGHWRLTTLLPPGRYVYAYLIDGQHFERDPSRDAVADPDFGVTGSELVVGEAP
jgi:hypothetical protein